MVDASSQAGAPSVALAERDSSRTPAKVKERSIRETPGSAARFAGTPSTGNVAPADSAKAAMAERKTLGCQIGIFARMTDQLVTSGNSPKLQLALQGIMSEIEGVIH